MPNREDVKAKVIPLLSVASNMKERESEIYDHEEFSLSGDLLLTQEMIGALAGPYTNISEGFGGREVTMNEAGSCKTVAAVIKLIYDKIPQETK